MRAKIEVSLSAIKRTLMTDINLCLMFLMLCDALVMCRDYYFYYRQYQTTATNWTSLDTTERE